MSVREFVIYFDKVKKQIVMKPANASTLKWFINSGLVENVTKRINDRLRGQRVTDDPPRGFRPLPVGFLSPTRIAMILDEILRDEAYARIPTDVFEEISVKVLSDGVTPG